MGQIETLGLHNKVSELQTITPNTERRKWKKIDCSSAPLRRSNRLKGLPLDDPLHRTREGKPFSEDDHKCSDDHHDGDEPCFEMEEVRAICDYEDIRKARILENKARLESLGLQKTISELRSISAKPKLQKKKLIKTEYSTDLLRRSSRVKSKPSDRTVTYKFEDDECIEFDNTHRPSPLALARRCSSKARGSVYDPVYGICCHFCRQKKLCGEDNCKRCGDLDLDQPCIGKTDCSRCHSSNGILCRACLKVRYGEEMEEVRSNKEWMCPHCVEEEGLNPYWICNSSFCLKKRRMAPTGIAIYKAREMGYKSVAHLLMDELKKQR